MNSPAMISGPIIDRLKYAEEDNPLTELFLHLLARSIDTDRINEAHPAFIHIIDQLSPDEALILFELSAKDISVVDTMDFDTSKNLFSNLKIIDGGGQLTNLHLQTSFRCIMNILQV